jgi:hypothetical protein
MSLLCFEEEEGGLQEAIDTYPIGNFVTQFFARCWLCIVKLIFSPRSPSPSRQESGERTPSTGHDPDVGLPEPPNLAAPVSIFGSFILATTFIPSVYLTYAFSGFSRYALV